MYCIIVSQYTIAHNITKKLTIHFHDVYKIDRPGMGASKCHEKSTIFLVLLSASRLIKIYLSQSVSFAFFFSHVEIYMFLKQEKL